MKNIIIFYLGLEIIPDFTQMFYSITELNEHSVFSGYVCHTISFQTANGAPQIMKCIHPRQQSYSQYSSILEHFHDELQGINDWELVICFCNIMDLLEISPFRCYVSLYIHVDLLNINERR